MLFPALDQSPVRSREILAPNFPKSIQAEIPQCPDQQGLEEPEGQAAAAAGQGQERSPSGAGFVRPHLIIANSTSY